MGIRKYLLRQKKRGGLQKQNCGANLELPCKRRIVFRRTRNDCSASNWLKQISLAARQIRSTTQIKEMTRHQKGISALVPQTSLGEGTSGGVAKCRLFSRARRNIIVLGAIACVASVSVWFQTKERRRNGIFGFGRARNETRAKKSGGGGEGVTKDGPYFPPPAPLFYSRHFSRSLWLSSLVLCSETKRKRLLHGLWVPQNEIR